MDNFFVELNHLDLLAVNGEDGGKFLQGQLTCDLKQADDQKTIPGAICNNKGRVLTNLRLFRYANTWYLEMPEGQLSANKANLDKFIVFYQADTTDASGQFFRLGLAGDNCHSILNSLYDEVPAHRGMVCSSPDHLLAKLSDGSNGSSPRYALWLPAENATKVLKLLESKLGKAPISAWIMEEIRDGWFNLPPELAGEFTPQPLNYDIGGQVSFDKGCYTGQEIVARMHYRGTPKKRLHRLSVADPAIGELQPPLPGLLTDDGQVAGQILQLCSDGESTEGLVIIDKDKFESESFRIEGYAENIDIRPLTSPSSP